MASVLSALGITGVSAPDPSAYKNIQLESSNLGEAKSGMKGTISNIDMALSGADLIGLPPSYTSSIKSLRDEANTALNSNMNSAQLAAKSTDISERLKLATKQQQEQRQADLVASLTAARDTISTRVDAVKADKTTSPELLAKFTDLLVRANASLTTAKKQTITKEGFQSPASTATPIQETADDLLAALDDLNALKDAEENKTFDWKRFGRKVLRVTMYFLFIISSVTGALLGGIVLSNNYAADYFWAIKLYYFVFGAALFPFSLAFGSAWTPLWLARIAPLVSLVPREIPSSAVQPVAAAKTKALPGASTRSKVPGASALGRLFGPKSGGDPDAVEPTAAEPPAAPAGPADPTKPNFGFFGYILPDDYKNPTPEQISSQNSLKILSRVNLTVWMLAAGYYGAFAVIQKIYKEKWL